MRAVAVDDDRAGADFVELGALHERAAERHGMRRFAADADDGRARLPAKQGCRTDARPGWRCAVSWPPNSVAAWSVETCAWAAAAGNGAPDIVVSVMTQ